MRHLARSAVRGVFGALVVAGLGFGAGQAFAAPSGAAGTAGVCSREEAGLCNYNCREQFGTGYTGVCTKNSFGHVSCGCRQIIFP